LMAAFLICLVVERKRLYIWDPIAKVTRDGVKVLGARASINFSNDLLLRDSSGGRTRVYLVQNWDDEVISPGVLTCVGVLACLTDADHASGQVVPAGSRGRRSPFIGVTMTNRRVEFVNEDGALVQVVLR
jgi:hypothetical protein